MFSPYVSQPPTLHGTLTYTLPADPVFPPDVVVQAKELLAAELQVAVGDLEEQQPILQWEFRSYPCPNPPVTKSTYVLMMRAGIAGAEKAGRGRGVVFLRKDIERHTTPTRTIYTCHLPQPDGMTRLFYASRWLEDLVTGSGDFYAELRHYVQRTVNRLDAWLPLQHDETLDGADTPKGPVDMQDDPEVTVIVELVSQGEWAPEQLLSGLAPYKHHEVSFQSSNFQVHRLGFVDYSDQQEMLLQRAVIDHEILAYDSLDLGRAR